LTINISEEGEDFAQTAGYFAESSSS